MDINVLRFCVAKRGKIFLRIEGRPHCYLDNKTSKQLKT